MKVCRLNKPKLSQDTFEWNIPCQTSKTDFFAEKLNVFNVELVLNALKLLIEELAEVSLNQYKLSNSSFSLLPKIYNVYVHLST